MGLLDKLTGKKDISPVLDDFLNDDDDVTSVFEINTRRVSRSQAEKIAVVKWPFPYG